MQLKKAALEKKKAERLAEKEALKEAKREEAKKKAEEEGTEYVSEDEEEEEEEEEEVLEEEETKEEEKKEELEQEDEEEPEIPDPVVDAGLRYRKRVLPDVSKNVFNHNFEKFSLPNAEEGFSKINYLWDKEPKAEEYLTKFVYDRKIREKVSGLAPSSWFKEKMEGWNQARIEWRRKQREWNDKVHAHEKKKADLQKKKDLEEKKKAEKAAQAEEGAEEEDPAVEEEPKEDEEEEEETFEVPDINEIDVWTCDDLVDVGEGMPLFAKFESEDWTLAGLRYEFHILLHAFTKDVPEDSRPGIHKDLLAHYYSLYARRQLIPEQCGCETEDALLEMMADVMCVGDDGILIADQEEESTNATFVKLTEEARRDRARRIEAGDESARLKFVQAKPKKGGRPEHPGKSGSGSGGKGTNTRRALPIVRQNSAYESTVDRLRSNMMRSAGVQGGGRPQYGGALTTSRGYGGGALGANRGYGGGQSQLSGSYSGGRSVGSYGQGGGYSQGQGQGGYGQSKSYGGAMKRSGGYQDSPSKRPRTGYGGSSYGGGYGGGYGRR